MSNHPAELATGADRAAVFDPTPPRGESGFNAQGFFDILGILGGVISDLEGDTKGAGCLPLAAGIGSSKATPGHEDTGCE